MSEPVVKMSRAPPFPFSAILSYSHIEIPSLRLSSSSSSLGEAAPVTSSRMENRIPVSNPIPNTSQDQNDLQANQQRKKLKKKKKKEKKKKLLATWSLRVYEREPPDGEIALFLSFVVLLSFATESSSSCSSSSFATFASHARRPWFLTPP